MTKKPPSSPWLTYVKERFSIPVHLILVSGLSATGVAASHEWKWPPFVIAFVCFMIFFFQLRLMDEFKDYDKDRTAHPKRPLPRGLLKPAAVRKVILGIQLLLFVLAGIQIAIPERQLGGLVFTGVVAYLWLMYKEFYVGHRLARYPFWYAVTHQLILFPMLAYPTALIQPDRFTHVETWLAGLVVFGAFFSYEICRKLNPKAHPILKTYLSLHGPIWVATVVTAFSLLSIYGSVRLDLHFGIAANEALVALTWGLLMVNAHLYKWVELAATFNLVVQIWVVPIYLYLKV